MSLNKTKILFCTLFILGGLILNGCGLRSTNEIEIPHDVDNYNYNKEYNSEIKIKTNFKPAGDKHEVNVY